MIKCNLVNITHNCEIIELSDEEEISRVKIWINHLFMLPYFEIKIKRYDINVI